MSEMSNTHWDPEPPRCAVCGAIVDRRPNKGEGVGWCARHGKLMPFVYPDSQEAENGEEPPE